MKTKKEKEKRSEQKKIVRVALQNGESWAKHIPDYLKQGISKTEAWRELFVQTLENNPDWTLTDIGRRYDVSRAYVSNVMKPVGHIALKKTQRDNPKWSITKIAKHHSVSQAYAEAVLGPVILEVKYQNLSLPQTLLDLVNDDAAVLRKTMRKALDALPADAIPRTVTRRFALPGSMIEELRAIGQRAVDADARVKAPHVSRTVEFVLWMYLSGEFIAE